MLKSTKIAVPPPLLSSARGKGNEYSHQRKIFFCGRKKISCGRKIFSRGRKKSSHQRKIRGQGTIGQETQTKSKQSKQVNIGISVPPIAARGPSRRGEGRKRRFLIACSDPLIAFLPPFYCIGEGSNVLLRLSEPG